MHGQATASEEGPVSSFTHEDKDNTFDDQPPMDLLYELSADWDELAHIDPLWAILSRADKKHMAWEINEFFSTGTIEADKVVEEAGTLGRPKLFQTALDFGCGVGRVARGLAHHFDQVVGVDVSPEMIRMAQEMNIDIKNLSFTVNLKKDLSVFPNETFDLVYSSRVLQHLPSSDLAKSYISELLRVVKDSGIVCFQLPARIGWFRRHFSKRQLYKSLRRMGFTGLALYKIGGLHPMELITVPEDEVVLTINLAGGNIVKIIPDEREIYFYKEGYIYYAVKSPCDSSTSRVD